MNYEASKKVVEMSKLAGLWDWLLPGLISLSPMGAVAYYSAGAEIEPPQRESARTVRRVLVSERLRGPAVIPLARL